MCIDPAADLQSAACCLVGVDRTGPARLRLHDVSVIGDRGDPADASWRSLGVQHTDCKGGKSRFREGFTSKWFLPPCFDSHDWQHTPAVVTGRTMVWSLTPTRLQGAGDLAAMRRATASRSSKPASGWGSWSRSPGATLTKRTALRCHPGRLVAMRLRGSFSVFPAKCEIAGCTALSGRAQCRQRR